MTVTTNLGVRCTAATVVVLALLVVPAPLLPPHRLADALQSSLGISWSAAYLLAGIGLRAIFYILIGGLATFGLNRPLSDRGRLFRIGMIPVFVVVSALLIRSVKVGHLPVWMNLVVPVTASVAGVTLGLGLLYRRVKTSVLVMVAALALVLFAMSGSHSPILRLAVEAHLRHIVDVSENLPPGDDRFGIVLQSAFASVGADSMIESPVQRNRVAILAWGIAAGHVRLARFAGLDSDSDLVRRAAALNHGTLLRGREDWSRHYAVSAALAVLEHPLISDAGGLMKEELDALAEGSGFSFGDLSADRAGVRFAVAATQTPTAAIAMRERVRSSFRVDDFFPAVSDFPEDLSVEQFRRAFGGVGATRYRTEVARIERRLDSCAALSPSRSLH
jgi:hypothetical protein